MAVKKTAMSSAKGGMDYWKFFFPLIPGSRFIQISTLPQIFFSHFCDAFSARICAQFSQPKSFFSFLSFFYTNPWFWTFNLSLLQI